MSAAMPLPQLTIPPTQPLRAADSPPAEPQTAAASADAATTTPSFAAVLKAQSATRTDAPREEASPEIAAEDAALIAFMAGVSIPAQTTPAPRLLSQLNRDKADLQTAEISGEFETPIAAVAAAAATLPTFDATTDATMATPVAMSAAQPPDPALIAALPTTLPGVAVPPAPTLAPTIKAPAGGPPPANLTAPAANHPPEIASGMPSRQPQLAASSANSADTANLAREATGSEASSEFRPLLERMTDATATTPTQTTPPASAAAQNSPAAPVQIRLTTPFAQPGWTQEVDQTLNWVVTSARTQADLVLNPPDLGRVEVTLVVKGDEVSASFASPHQAVREAIEESLVRLRESLAESGIQLGQTHVGRDSSRDAPFVPAQGDARHSWGQRNDAALAQTSRSAWLPAPGRGMVDVFA